MVKVNDAFSKIVPDTWNIPLESAQFKLFLWKVE
jgi:hypothetical protein